MILGMGTRKRAPKVPGGRIRIPVRLDPTQYSKLEALQAHGEPAAGVLVRALEAMAAANERES
jgi:hypothetical protein